MPVPEIVDSPIKCIQLQSALVIITDSLHSQLPTVIFYDHLGFYTGKQ